MKNYLWAFPIAGIYFVFETIFGALPTIIMRLLGFEKAANAYNRFWMSFTSDFILFFLNIHVKVIGDLEGLKKELKSGRKICFIANHTSMMDIPVMSGTLCLGCGYIMLERFKHYPFINAMGIAADCVFIPANDMKRGVEAIRKGAERIEKGQTFAVFPEGKRSKTGEIDNFKPGSFRLAFISGADIIPLTIKGVRDGFEDRKSFFGRVDGTVHIGSPVRTENLDRDKRSEVCQKVEQQIKTTYATL